MSDMYQSRRTMPARRVGRRVALQLLATAATLPTAARAQIAAPPPDPTIWLPRDPSRPITQAREALSVFDFEPAMQRAVRPAHFGYMATGTDDEATLRANRRGFARYRLRSRRLVDVSRLDTSVELFGLRYASPIAIAPTGSNRAFHEDGELAVTRAARLGNHPQMLSSVATTSIEEVIAARGAPVWFQLYTTQRWDIAEKLAQRAERAGAAVLVVTVDVLARQNWETMRRFWRTDNMQDCRACHGPTLRDFVARKPAFDGLDIAGLTSTGQTNLTWDMLRRLRDLVKMKIVIKGILTAEDAVLALDNGFDGLVVSNHGGRSEDNGASTIEALGEILAAVRGRMPVLIDSGFRRGTDIAKALAMGARAVCIGRPYLWGLGAFGQEGVERVLEILRTELLAVMQQLGAPDLASLVPAMVEAQRD